MKNLKQHPIIAEIVALCVQRGAVTYVGENFVSATFSNGDQLEARIKHNPPPLVYSSQSGGGKN